MFFSLKYLAELGIVSETTASAFAVECIDFGIVFFYLLLIDENHSINGKVLVIVEVYDPFLIFEPFDIQRVPEYATEDEGVSDVSAVVRIVVVIVM